MKLLPPDAFRSPEAWLAHAEQAYNSLFRGFVLRLLLTFVYIWLGIHYVIFLTYLAGVVALGFIIMQAISLRNMRKALDQLHKLLTQLTIVDIKD